MFVAKATKKEQVEIFVSTVLHGFLNFAKTRLPTESVSSHTFTVMDTSEETVFLHVQTLGAEIPLGNIFVSDGSGKFYSMSLQNVLRGQELVDFEKVNSLEGVFLANKFEESSSHANRDSILPKDNKKKFTKAEIEAQSIKEARMS